MADENESVKEAQSTTSIWGTLGKIGSGTAAAAIAGLIGTWAWNTIDRHEKEIIRMREEIRFLQQKTEKVDAQETDIAILKAIYAQREVVK